MMEAVSELGQLPGLQLLLKSGPEFIDEICLVIFQLLTSKVKT